MNMCMCANLYTGEDEDIQVKTKIDPITRRLYGTHPETCHDREDGNKHEQVKNHYQNLRKDIKTTLSKKKVQKKSEQLDFTQYKSTKPDTPRKIYYVLRLKQKIYHLLSSAHLGYKLLFRPGIKFSKLDKHVSKHAK